MGASLAYNRYDADRVVGHDAPITTVDLSPDESVIVTGGYDGRVCIWLEDGTSRCIFQAPQLLNLVRFDPMGREVACASADNKVYVVDVDSGELVSVAGPFGDDINAAVWRTGHRQIAIAAETFDPVLRLWDIDDNRECATFEGHTDCVCGVAFDGDGGRLATASEDGTARIWDLDSTRCLAVMEHPKDPECIDWSPDSRFVVTGCNDGVLRLYDGRDYSLVGENRAADAAVRFVRFERGGRTVLAGSYDGHLRRLTMPDLELEASFSSLRQWERSAAGGRSKLVVGSVGNEPVVYDRDGEIVRDGGRTYGINTLDADSGETGVRVFVGRDDGMVVEGIGSTVVARGESLVNCVALSPDGTLIASCDYRGNVDISMTDGTALARLHPGGTGPLNTIVWLDSDSVVTAGYSGELVHCTLATNSIATRVLAHGGPIKSLCVDEATGFIVAGSSDHTVSVWKGDKKVAEGSDDNLVLINGVAILRSGSTFVSCSRDRAVRVWDLHTAEIVDRLPRVHARSIKAISADGDGRRIMTSSYDGGVVIWERGQDSWQWRDLDMKSIRGVPAVKIAGEYLVAGGWDGSIALWGSDGQLARRLDLTSVS